MTLVSFRRPAALVRAVDWWRARSTRVRLRLLVASVGLLGLVLKDLLLIASAALTFVLAEIVPQRAPRPRPL